MKTRLLIMLTCLFASGSIFATPADSDCFESNGSPGCDDAACEAIVAAVDPFCVNITWDGICAGEAAELCVVNSIDIKPGSDTNPVNTKTCKGLIPVALLGSPTFDATAVDPDTLAFGPDGAGFAHKDVHYDDVDEDGNTDLLAHFACSETGIASGDTEACLSYGEKNLLLSETDSNCFVSNAGLGCDNVECTGLVGAIDPFCVGTSWDSICAGEAVDLCSDLVVGLQPEATLCDTVRTVPAE